MPIIDVLLTAAFGGAGFVMGFFIRRAFIEGQPDASGLKSRSLLYEPPRRRNERL